MQPNRFGGAFREYTGSVPLIGKVLRGTRVAGLIWYLYGPGRHEEHTDPHLVAGWRDPAELEPVNDYFRVREACLAVERQYGLLVTAPGDRTAGRRPTRAENEDARRRGWEEPARITLRRAVHTAAAGASSEQEFFVRVEAAGLLVRRRFSQRDPGQVTGYAVAKPGHVNGQGRQCGSVAGSSLPT